VLAYSSLAFGGAIHDAASAGDLEKVKALLKANPNLVFSKDTNGLTPLHFAAANGHKDVAELLLANKAEVDAKSNAKTTRGGTPLHLAAMNGREDVAALLLASKADVNASDHKGRTALDWAKGHKEVMAVLLQAITAAKDTR
jgi:ankyrin repeat protein